MAQWLKNPPANAGDAETRVQSLGRGDPLEEEMATHSSILAWENPMDRGARQATVPGVAKELDLAESKQDYFLSKISIINIFTSHWDLNPCAGTQTQPKPCMGLEPTDF